MSLLGFGDNPPRKGRMQQEYNIGDLWQWARSGSLIPFMLTRHGEPVCRVIRVNGDDMDWLYAQYEPDDGMFTVPFEPFGLWGWPERMCCVRDEYAGLGNWSLHEAEQRLTQAYRDAAVAQINQQADQIEAENLALTAAETDTVAEIAAALAERGISVSDWADTELIQLGEPQIHIGALFANEQQEIERIQQSVQDDNAVIRDAARLVAAMKRAERPEELAPAPEPEAPASEQREAAPDTEAVSTTDTAEQSPSRKGEQALKAVIEALTAPDAQRVRKVILSITKGKGKKHNYKVPRLVVLEDLEKYGTIQPDHLDGDFKRPVPAKSVERITKLNGADVLYQKE